MQLRSLLALRKSHSRSIAGEVAALAVAGWLSVLCCLTMLSCGQGGGVPSAGAAGGASMAGMDAGNQRTTRPIVTGTSVLALKYKDGVMMACDTLASYGSLARYKNVERIKSLAGCTLVGAAGEMSDFQAIMEILEEEHQQDLNMDDGFTRSACEVHSFLRATMYARRNKFNPLWNYLLVGGFKDGQAFLGSVDHIGTAYEDNFLATGFGAHLAIPLMRKRWHKDMEEGEARALLEDCLRVLFYRDCRALNRVQIAKATAEGTLVSEPFTLTTSWSLASFQKSKAGQDTDGSW